MKPWSTNSTRTVKKWSPYMEAVLALAVQREEKQVKPWLSGKYAAWDEFPKRSWRS